MKATIDVPRDLYRQVEAKSASEGKAIREVAVELFQLYVGTEGGEPLPSWFGALRKYARQAQDHDMETIRRSIAAGVAEERGL